MNKLFIVAGLLCFIGCAPKAKKRENPSEDFKSGVRLAKLSDKKLNEASGLAASIANPGYLWTLNDSGNGPDIFLIDQELNVVATYHLEGVENRDWEDIAIGPGEEEGKQYLYVGEIGDNRARYPLKYIYRFEEPRYSVGQDQITVSKFDTITFQLPGKNKDTETLMVDPKTKAIYIVSKREKPVYVYELRYPYSTDDTITAIEIASLPLTEIVAGDFSENGNEVLMKSYDFIYYWNNRDNKPFTELLKETPFSLPYDAEPQGESITWSPDGKGFFTLSEKNKGLNSYLYFYERKAEGVN